MSKSDHIHEETIRKSKEACAIVTAVYVTDWDMFITVRLLEDSPAVSSQRKIWRITWFSSEWKETVTHNDHTWQNHPSQVGFLCTDSRTWSWSRHMSPERCTCCIGRPRAGSSRLASASHGRTGRRRIWIIRQWWSNISQNTTPFIPETFEQIWRAT